MASFAQLQVGRDEPILDPELPIVDAHHHLLVRPGLRYLLDDYLADAKAGHRIVASVYVEVLTFARRDGPELLDRALEAAPERFRGVRQIAIEDPSEAPYRFITNRPPRGLYKSPGFCPALRQVVQRGLTFDIAVFHHQLGEAIELADAFPDATFVLGHCGHAMAMDMSEPERAEVFRTLRASMIELGRRPNVYCKVGGLGLPFWGFKLEERNDAIGSAELAALWRPFVETSIEAFGAQRCMMESDYPIDGRSAGFVPLWNALKHIVRGASADEKAALFHRTATRVYRLRLPDDLKETP